jgi:hypothetical protein
MTFSNRKEQNDYLTFSFRQNFVLLDVLCLDNHIIDIIKIDKFRLHIFIIDRKKTECRLFYRTLASDDYNDVRLGGHGTLHGYSNIVNPFLEVSLLLYLIINIHFF